MNEPRDVGDIEGREVPPPHGPPAGMDPSDPPAPGTHLPAQVDAESSDAPGALARAWDELRHSRGKDVPNSRPLPEWVRRFAWVLDDAFAVPGTEGRRVGVDGLISIVPVAGDAVGIGLSLVIVVVGVGAGVSIPTILRMLLNVGVEALIGLVPLVGIVFNMAYKANNRNVALIEADLGDRRSTRRSSLSVVFLSVAVLVFGTVMLWVAALAGLVIFIWLLAQLF